MFRVMGEIDDPVGDDLFVRRLRGAGTHIMGRASYPGGILELVYAPSGQ